MNEGKLEDGWLPFRCLVDKNSSIPVILISDSRRDCLVTKGQTLDLDNVNTFAIAGQNA